ncbi:hypothetical protein ACFX2I_036502 [Malus domestica]
MVELLSKLIPLVVREWKETYGWIPIFGAVAAIAAAFSTGANNLPSPFSTPIGSGSLTLLKAFEAAFASCGSFVNDLFSDVRIKTLPIQLYFTSKEIFLKENQPSEGFLMWSMVVVVETAAIWLALATYLQLPVSPQQSMQGALLGTILVTEGFSYIPLRNKNANHNFNRGGLLWIFLERTVAPFIAFACVLFLFSVMKASLLHCENVEKGFLFFSHLAMNICRIALPLFHVSGHTVYKCSSQ